MIFRSKPTVLLSILMVIPCILQAQTSESYIAKLVKCRTAGDSADNYAWAAMCAAAEYEKENGMVYARKAEQLAKTLKDPMRLAAAYFALSNLYLGIDESDSARIYGLKSVEQYATGPIALAAPRSRTVGSITYSCVGFQSHAKN